MQPPNESIRPDRLLIVCAVAQELAALRLSASFPKLICGVGPVESGMTLAAHLATNNYDAIVNVGIAGCFTSAIDIGASVIVTEEYYYDLGREDSLALLLPDGEKLATHIALSEQLSLQKDSCSAHFGVGITSATITTSAARAARILEQFPNAVTESMEGFALARAASRHAIPFFELRGISNRVGDRKTSGWDFQAGITAAAELTHEVIDQLLCQA